MGIRRQISDSQIVADVIEAVCKGSREEVYSAKLIETFEDNEGTVYNIDVTFYNNLTVFIDIIAESLDVTDDGFTYPSKYSISGHGIYLQLKGEELFIGDCQDKSSLADYVNWLIDINDEYIIYYVFK